MTRVGILFGCLFEVKLAIDKGSLEEFIACTVYTSEEKWENNPLEKIECLLNITKTNAIWTLTFYIDGFGVLEDYRDLIALKSDRLFFLKI